MLEQQTCAEKAANTVNTVELSTDQAKKLT